MHQEIEYIKNCRFNCQINPAFNWHAVLHYLSNWWNSIQHHVCIKEASGFLPSNFSNSKDMLTIFGIEITKTMLNLILKNYLSARPTLLTGRKLTLQQAVNGFWWNFLYSGSWPKDQSDFGSNSYRDLDPGFHLDPDPGIFMVKFLEGRGMTKRTID